MKTRCLIVDDEPLAIKLIESHISKLDNIEVIDTCNNAMVAFDVLRKKQVDLIFLDIQMPQITGLEFLRALKDPPKVIFTTAYRKYALEGFELDVVDYLLKPVSFERFLKAINKYFHSLSVGTQPGSAEVIQGRSKNEFIDVKENKKTLRIYLRDIRFIEGLNEYIGIHTENKRIVTKNSLANIEAILPSGQFIRIHKSFIVQVSRIQAFSSTLIEVDGKQLPIGRSYKDTVLEALNYQEE